MRYDNLIWDFDGTLFDTYPVINRAVRRALADLRGVEVEKARVAALLSDTLGATVETLAAEHDLDPAAFEARIQVYRDAAPLAERPPFPGAIRVCERLRAAGGRNFLYTHRDRASLLAMLDYHGVTGLFADIVTADENLPRKPDPAGFRLLVERHNLLRDKTLGVGDRDLDVLGAYRAGIAACLYAAEPGAGVAPEYVIADFAALERLLGL